MSSRRVGEAPPEPETYADPAMHVELQESALSAVGTRSCAIRRGTSGQVVILVLRYALRNCGPFVIGVGLFTFTGRATPDRAARPYQPRDLFAHFGSGVIKA